MLLTGFQSYGERAINPTEEIIKRLDGRNIGGEQADGRILPVDYRGLEPAIRETTPCAVICRISLHAVRSFRTHSPARSPGRQQLGNCRREWTALLF
ncbi:MAG: hypothetical protein ACR2RA_04575 [Geminicoccaceae bacterium]